MKRVMKTIIAAAMTTALTSVAMATNTKCNHQKGGVAINDNTAVAQTKAVFKPKTNSAFSVKGINL